MPQTFLQIPETVFFRANSGRVGIFLIEYADTEPIVSRQTKSQDARMPPALIELSDTEKLATLRQLDHFREWRSLDESRYCLVCGNLFTGRQIRIIVDHSGPFVQEVKCPTEHCNSIAIDWVQPTDEILAALAKRKLQAGSPIEH